MSNKTDTDNFLKKELKAIADEKGHSVIDEQSTFDDKSAKKVRVKSKKVKVRKTKA